MKFKGIDDFTIEDCREYLRYNPEGEWASAVRNRMQVLQQVEIENRKKMEREQGGKRYEQYELMGEKIIWKDFRGFLTKEGWEWCGLGVPYFKEWLLIGISLLFEVLLLCFEVFVFSLESYIILGCVMMVELFLFVFVCLRIIDYSMYLFKICDIEDSSSNIRRVRNRVGRIGLCRLKKKGIGKLLPMAFDAIYPCGMDVYICREGNRYGLYNIQRRKMVVPINYDMIELKEGVFEVMKDGVRERFTENGFRLVE